MKELLLVVMLSGAATIFFRMFLVSYLDGNKSKATTYLMWAVLAVIVVGFNSVIILKKDRALNESITLLDTSLMLNNMLVEELNSCGEQTLPDNGKKEYEI